MTNTEATQQNSARPGRKTRVGVVVSNKMQKTAVVRVTRLAKHAVFKKYHKLSKKYMVHDETNQCGIGDTVLIREMRPLSRHKRWVVEQIIEKAQ